MKKATFYVKWNKHLIEFWGRKLHNLFFSANREQLLEVESEQNEGTD